MRKNDLSHHRLMPNRPAWDVAMNSPVGLSAREVGGDENDTGMFGDNTERKEGGY